MAVIVKEIYDAFRSAGVSDEQATAAGKVVPMVENLATKSDLIALRNELRTEFRNELQKLRDELSAEFRKELQAEIASVRAEMKFLESRMTVRLYASIGAAVALIKALDVLIEI